VLKIGHVYQLTILDHAMTSGDSLSPILCQVYGKVIKSDKYCYYVATWICGENESNHNTECFAILKSAIVAKRRLK
jgi:hypothetical protein